MDIKVPRYKAGFRALAFKVRYHDFCKDVDNANPSIPPIDRPTMDSLWINTLEKYYKNWTDTSLGEEEKKLKLELAKLQCVERDSRMAAKVDKYWKERDDRIKEGAIIDPTSRFMTSDFTQGVGTEYYDWFKLLTTGELVTNSLFTDEL